MARLLTADDLYALKRVEDPQTSPDGTHIDRVAARYGSPPAHVMP